MRLLQVIRSLHPAQGGTVESLKQLSVAVEAMGHAVEVLSLDDPAADWLRDFPVVLHALGPARGGYGHTPRLVPWLKTHAGDYDAVLVNGLWQYHSYGVYRALAGTATPYFVYPHGMLDPWFKRQYPLKHMKKWLYWPWGEYRVLRDAHAVLFTGREEAIKARQSFWLSRWREAVVSLGISPPPGDPTCQREAFFERYPALRDKPLLLFLGRIHEKKGCDLVIDGFAARAARAGKLHLVMAGPDASGWRQTLEKRARDLGVAERITWTGMLTGDLKWGALHAADAFILPSHQENFGVVVAEALACGCPVLISDRIDIWREVESERAGLVAEDSMDGVCRLLDGWLGLNEGEKRAMRAAARACFAKRFEIRQAAQSLLDALYAHGVKSEYRLMRQTGT